ncbi:hypothetical protein B296_00042086, partial [Ensete ventricosum]
MQRGGGAASHGKPLCRVGHPRPGWLQGGSRPRPKSLAGVAASMCGRPWALLAPAGAAPAGVAS